MPEPMKRETIKTVLAELSAAEPPLASRDALEAFGREGDWHTVYYSGLVRSLEVWEVVPAMEAGLRRNLPNAKIKITDAFKEVRHTPSTFDLIVIDNPQSVFGGGYCKHFDIYPHLFRVVRPQTIVVQNVNLRPYIEISESSRCYFPHLEKGEQT